MGDRSNVFIQQGVRDGVAYGIGVYSHWGGKDVQKKAVELIGKAMPRAGDASYFTRILVHNLLNEAADPNSETGCGLWTDVPDDNEHSILVISADSGAYKYVPEGQHRLPI